MILRQEQKRSFTQDICNERWFLFPVDKDEVDREGGEDHDAAHPGLEGPGHHGDEGDEDSGQDVEHGPHQAHPDGPLPLRMSPPQPGNAEHGHSYRDLQHWPSSGFTPLNIEDEELMEETQI